VVNVVVCNQLLSAVSGYTMIISVNCIIVVIISYVFFVFGFAFIHAFEKYSWILPFILIYVLIGQAALNVSSSVPALDTGLSLIGSFLSFLTINFFSASG
jgi:purine-cytosine permease-like protein